MDPRFWITTTVKRESVGAHNGLRTVAWQQKLDGFAILDGVLVCQHHKKGELASISSQLIG